MPAATLSVAAPHLRHFSFECLRAVGVPDEQAETVADVLAAADLAGVDSHGVARLRRYVDGVARGAIDGQATPVVVRETAATALLDARNGLGQPAGVAAMRRAIDLAAAAGIGMVAVRRSNHYGIAGYYAQLAADRGMIGVATTNASPQVAPTFGAEPMFGTNPLAVAVPTGGDGGFLLDAATSTVGRGKLEVRHRRGEPIPEGWAIDGTGAPRTDAAELIEGLKQRRGYSLLPLGGAGELHGGHKGYGLGVLVDLLCGPLAGAAWGRHVYSGRGADLGHCFIAIDVEAFRPLLELQAEARQMFDELRGARRAPGHDRILLAGEREAEERARREREGVPLTPAVHDDLARLGRERNVPFPASL